jgi:hypothetical protein
MTGDEYRSRANECIAAADQVTDPQRKISLLQLAQRWLRLAFQAEKIGDDQGLKGDALLDQPDGRSR